MNRYSIYNDKSDFQPFVIIDSITKEKKRTLLDTRSGRSIQTGRAGRRPKVNHVSFRSAEEIAEFFRSLKFEVVEKEIETEEKRYHNRYEQATRTETHVVIGENETMEITDAYEKMVLGTLEFFQKTKRTSKNFIQSLLTDK